MPPARLPGMPLGLVEILEPEVCRCLKWARLQTKLSGLPADCRPGGSLRKAQIADGQLYGLQGKWFFRSDEPVAREERLCGLIELDPLLGQRL